MTQNSRDGGAERTSLLEVYRTMRTIREFEQRVHQEFGTGDLPGAVHLYAGQEAVATGVCAALREHDYIASTHRGHGHAVAKGCDLTGMMLELYGRAGGLCGGKGGSMHIADFERGMLGANGVAAGGVPLAVGAALSAKVRGSGQVAVAFVGDGGANQGVFAESMTLAAVWHLPVVFVVEDNGYAQATGTRYHLNGNPVAARGQAVGVESVEVDGYDVFAVRDAADQAVRRAREEGGPSLLECKANRFYGHMEGWDQQAYRLQEEIDTLWDRHDCIKLFTQRVLSEGTVSAGVLAAVDEEVRVRVDAAVEEARHGKEPDVSELLTDVYASY